MLQSSLRQGRTVYCILDSKYYRAGHRVKDYVRVAFDTSRHVIPEVRLLRKLRRK